MIDQTHNKALGMSINVCYRCLTQAELDALSVAVREDADAVREWLYPETPLFTPPAPELWLERSWLGLHSLLTFEPWKQQPLLAKAILGGTRLGFPFVHTEVNYLNSEEVREIAFALEAVNENALQASFDADAMNASGLPPVGGWIQDDFPYLWQTFIQIRDFFHEAACLRDAMLIYLC